MGHGGWLVDVVVGHIAVAQSVFDKASTFLLVRSILFHTGSLAKHTIWSSVFSIKSYAESLG